MKFLLLSDIHATDKIPVARKDNISETFDSKFSFILNYAVEKEIDAILQAGDLSDQSRSWTVLDYYMVKLKLYKIPFMTVFGQHDMYLRSKTSQAPTTMLTLIRSGMISPLSSDPVAMEDVSIYGANWGEKIPTPTRNHKNILVLHKSIAEKEEWSGHDYTHPKYFLKKHDRYDLILVGDIHRSFTAKINGRQLVNTGPLLRLEANSYNFGHNPKFFVWDSDDFSLEEVYIPCRPPEEVLTRDHIDPKKISKRELEAFTVALKNINPKELRKEKIKKFIRKIKERRVKQIIMEIINGNRTEN